MEEPKYMTYDGHHLATKNKLQKAVADYLTGLDRILIEKKKLAYCKKQILEDIKDLNKKHKRCTPIEASWRKHKDDYMLQGIHFSNFHIYQINKIII